MNQKIDFLFFSPEIRITHCLNETDSMHCVRVLRKTKGEVIHVTDGLGGLYTCEILLDNPKSCRIGILEELQGFNVQKREIHLAICPTKSAERIEYFVEKSVEIGVSSIQFVLSKNTYPKKVNIERMNKIAVSAMKQSLKAYKPYLPEAIKFEKFIMNSGKIPTKFIAHLDSNSKNLISVPMSEEMLIFIGPEGDFSKEEIQIATQNEFQPVFFGNARLRTETAGVVAVSLLNLLP